MNALIASAALALAALASRAPQAPAAEARPSECRVVRARYAIYVENDLLRVVGSKHLLVVAIKELDQELQARGWQDTVVYGDFTLCAERVGDPRELTIRDRVEVTGYTNLSYRRR